jgi:hypothetical protein
MAGIEKKKVYTVSGIECIGPCVPPNISYFHPVILRMITNPDHATCPTNLYIANNGNLSYTGKCNESDCENFNLTDMVTNFTIPSLEMKPDIFLKLIYKINSFEDTINWINNHNDNVYETVDRILNCAWDKYIKEIPNIKILFIDFYKEFTQKYWMKYISKNIKQSQLIKTINNNELMEKIIYNSFRKILYEYSTDKNIPYNKEMKKFVRYYIAKYSK